ncbi:hypothetical protein ASD74_09240 [Rhizobium sp. Root564]|nr:hypothetical protein ASD74_09240 [Rhizobium sp. Root564]
MDRDFLKIGNHRKISDIYSHFMNSSEIDKIRLEISRHTASIYHLSLHHYTFAASIPKRQWRQRVSRLYYAGYNASKAIRFDNDGSHSTDVKDHSKVGLLPDRFPNKATYENELKNLREDRNSCDYDHLSTITDLLAKPNEYQNLILQFLRDTHDYLSARGNTLGGRP